MDEAEFLADLLLSKSFSGLKIRKLWLTKNQFNLPFITFLRFNAFSNARHASSLTWRMFSSFLLR